MTDSNENSNITANLQISTMNGIAPEPELSSPVVEMAVKEIFHQPVESRPSMMSTTSVSFSEDSVNSKLI